MREVFVIGAKRTPIGGFRGSLSSLPAPVLGGAAICAAVEDSGIDVNQVEEVVMGCVLPAGQGQAPGRQAGFHAGLTENVPATTVNKMCGSGMKTVMTACDQIALGRNDVIAAGGMESMSKAPYLLTRMRDGAQLGHSQAVDHMFLDGLEDAYEPGRLMGTYAEDCAEAYQFTRDDQDSYALSSLDRALAAQSSGAFDQEIVPVKVSGRKGTTEVAIDQQPGTARPEKIPQLKPAFRPDGTVTAANSSSISDGAAALILASERFVEAGNGGDSTVRPIARIAAAATHAQSPGLFTTAPVPAARKLLAAVGWAVSDVDLWEVNEAFAVVPMAFEREMGISRARLNIHGGACSLGHPIGASGARILITLLAALERTGGRRGVAAICIGGGEATAVAVERC
ncbi:MAG: thiolase family protein [Paracoccaceae bacterium]|nr:thiolase family protein [Paracoccaceae bacterium]